ncbi:hypothetical protein [Ralstonia mannitolilytica]|uniref:hypothetical protein n=1 Tax=Ralstonia mannitolilytica TaxID=105219 RepID=UPI0007AFEFC5|nr:hypothetical protein [Ralstonia mannitolilytica]ANA34323.1 hypothetical protein VZ52_13465 [Ralstonia mannitolilytica]
MTDQELLVRAGTALCKSRGLPLYNHRQDEQPAVFTYMGRSWNPLEDDGDALRLAVALRISIDPREDGVCAIAGNNKHVVIEMGNGELLVVATRRAIVRAAAMLAAD